MTKILIIDDDEEDRTILGEYLESAGYLCTYAADAAAARKILRNKKFPLILSDIHMPGESGLDFMKWALSENPETVGLIMSGLLTREIEKKAASIGVFCCLRKAVDLDLLLECLFKASGRVQEPRSSAQ
jgi:DNA-binding NtrC family response regulator